MGVLKDLGNLIEREEEDEEELGGEEDQPSIKKIASKFADDEEEDEKASGSDVGEILTHIDNLKKIIEFVDAMTSDEAETPAFEAEVSLRKALQKMEDLADSSNKNKTDKE